MNKTLVWGIIGVAVIGGGVAVFVNRDSSPPNLPVPAESSDGSLSEGAVSADPTRAMPSVNELLASGDSRSCTFANEDASGKNSGTVYFSGGKMRGDFKTAPAGGTPVDSHMIVDGGFSYVWASGDPQGLKIPYDANAGSGGAAEGSLSFDFNEGYEYDCATWIPEAAKFSLPAGIQFADVSSFGVPGQ